MLVTLGIIQAGIHLHGRNVAQRAATAAVDAARGSYGTTAEAQEIANGIARSGGLEGVSVRVTRGATPYRRRDRKRARHPGHRQPDPRDRLRAPRAGDPAMIHADLGACRNATSAARPRVELTVLVPALLLILGLIIAGGRVWFARTTVNEAAHSAARAASLARSAAEAGSRRTVRRRAVAGHRRPALRLHRRRGQHRRLRRSRRHAGHDHRQHRCRVAFADLLLPGMPGSIDLTATGASALDTYRSR